MMYTESALMDHPGSELSGYSPNPRPSVPPDEHGEHPRAKTDWQGVIIADPQHSLGELFVERLQRSLAPLAIWSATTIDEVLVLVQRHPRVVVVTAQRLADGSALQLARLVRAESPQARLTLWTDHAPQLIAPDEYSAIIPRSASIAAFEDAVMRALASQARGGSVIAAVATKASARRSSVAVLSDRQLELLVLIAEGLSIKEIAQRWRLTNKSVDSLKYRLMKELNIHNRVDLARLAILEGLVDPRQIGGDESST